MTSTQRTALVTGAAKGIGRAAVTALVDRDWRVGAYDVDEQALTSLAGDRVVTGRLDVTSEEDWTRALGELCGDGGLDLLHNNAGILSSGPFREIPLARQRQIIDTNVVGVLNGAYLAFPYLQRSRGLLVNMCSASAIYGQPDLVAYSASKFAVRGLTEGLELEWASAGVGVAALWPLFVDTDMVVGLDTASTESLGIRLTAEDVAADLLRLVDAHEKRRGRAGRAAVFRSVHRRVGRQAQVLGSLAQVSPEWVNRLSNKLINKA